MRNASGHQGENERQWKTKVNRNTISSTKRVTRKFLEVSRLIMQSNGKEKCATRAKFFFWKKCAARAKLLFC